MRGTTRALPRNAFEIEVAGVTFNNRQDLIDLSLVGSEVFLIRDKGNTHDDFAIGVLRHDGEQLGFIPMSHSRALAPPAEYQALSGVVKEVVGGTPEKPCKGLRLWVWDDEGCTLAAMLAASGGLR